MYELKRKSLAGKCGIPFEKDQIYVKAEYNNEQRREVPDLLRFEDGRSWQPQSILRREEFGRDFFGNVCTHYQIYVGKDVKDLWAEYGQWFVRK